MCYTTKITNEITKLTQRFGTTELPNFSFSPLGDYIGFTFPKTPIITNLNPNTLQLFSWGLMPTWAKDKNFRKNTLNAKIETINEKPSFKDSAKNRCLVIIDGFYEWQWQDEKGKQKQKYFLSMPNNEPFALGGIWNVWKDIKSGETIENYCIVTTIANEQMAVIHNSKKRMPLVLTKENEMDWLKGKPFETFNEFPVLSALKVV